LAADENRAAITYVANGSDRLSILVIDRAGQTLYDGGAGIHYLGPYNVNNISNLAEWIPDNLGSHHELMFFDNFVYGTSDPYIFRIDLANGNVREMISYPQINFAGVDQEGLYLAGIVPLGAQAAQLIPGLSRDIDATMVDFGMIWEKDCSGSIPQAAAMSDKIYLLNNGMEDERFLCSLQKSGEKVWETRFLGYLLEPVILTTPDKVYLVDNAFGVREVDRVSGMLGEPHRLDKEYIGKPVIHDGKIYFLFEDGSVGYFPL
jgi:hypothetical protein